MIETSKRRRKMSIKIDNKLSMEFNDTESQKKLMELYGNCESTFFGINEKGEDIELHISNNEISKSIISPITIKSTSLCAHIYWIGDFAISEKITITTIFLSACGSS